MIFFCVECKELLPEEFGYFDFAYLLGGLGHLNCDLFGFGHHVVNELDDEEERGEEGFCGILGEAVHRLAVEFASDRGPQELDVFNDVH